MAMIVREAAELDVVLAQPCDRLGVARQFFASWWKGWAWIEPSAPRTYQRQVRIASLAPLGSGNSILRARVPKTCRTKDTQVKMCSAFRWTLKPLLAVCEAGKRMRKRNGSFVQGFRDSKLTRTLRHRAEPGRGALAGVGNRQWAARSRADIPPFLAPRPWRSQLSEERSWLAQPACGTTRNNSTRLKCPARDRPFARA